MVGLPPGFAGARGYFDLPLVGPLEDGLLVVSAKVGGQGPFLFALDPDAKVSVVDDEVVKRAGLRIGAGPHLLDETDTQHPHFYAEVPEWDFGELQVHRRSAVVVKDGAYDSAGRRIHGLIGRDVIADSLMFGFDRDAGLAYLWPRKQFEALDAPWTSFEYQQVPSLIANAEVLPVPRRVISAEIDGQPYELHVDFGEVASQLRERSWQDAGLAPRDVDASAIDDTGTVQPVRRTGLAAGVQLGAATAARVPFVPYRDRRWPEDSLEGTLGLGFFRPFTVWADWDGNKIYLRARQDPGVARRIARWGAALPAGCAHVGCAEVAMVDPLASVPADQRPAQHPGVVVTVTRDAAAAGRDLELVVAAGPRLPKLIVNLPAAERSVMTHLSADYVGAALTVIDASPFPRACPAGGACIDRL